MPSNFSLRHHLIGSIAGAALAATAVTAEAADVDVSSATIAAGKLVIKGSTAAPRTRVRLDGQAGGDFNVTSNADGKFTFDLVYLPSDCIVALQRVTSPSTLGPSTEAVVANCARGISPRGAWSAATRYSSNDLVTYRGSSWLARSDNTGKAPAGGDHWQLFAANGADGSAGANKSGDASAARADTPIGPAGGDLSGSYPNPKIRNAVVIAAKIAAGAVTEAKLAPGAVTASRIGKFAVNGSKINAGAVITAKLAAGAVTSAKILDGTIVQADLAANSVGAAQIQTDAVGATEIADNSIDSGEIIDNSLFSQDLGASSVRGSELGTIIRRSATSAAIAGNGIGNIGVQCLAGERIIAGGNDASSASGVVIAASRNDGANGWRVFARNLSASNQTVTVHAYCLQAS